jgi:hypothetical protein
MPKSFSKWMGEALCGDTVKLHRELIAQMSPAQADELDTAIAKLDADMEEKRNRQLEEAAERKAAQLEAKNAKKNKDPPIV